MHKFFRTIALYAGILFYTALTLLGQEPLWGLYWNNQSLINPAMSGFGVKSQAYIQNRLQWTSLKAGPKTVAAAFDANVEKVHGGAGIMYMYDKIGSFTTQNVQLNYNYQIKLRSAHQFSIGLAVNYRNMVVEFDSTMTTQWPDPAIPTTKTSDNTIGINAGLAYRFKGFEAGISMNNINTPKMKDIGFSFQQHSYLYARYEWEKNSKVTIIPTFIVRHQRTSIAPDLNVNLKYNSKYIIGAGYRLSNSILFNGGYEIGNKFSVLACYEFKYTKPQFGPSFEFALVYKLKQEE